MDGGGCRRTKYLPTPGSDKNVIVVVGGGR